MARATQTGLTTAVLLAGVLLGAAAAQTNMKMEASGTFDVTIKPQAPDDHSDNGAIARMLVDKTFHGELEGTSVATMVTGMSPTEKTSGVYVAIERFTGTLNGRRGSFIVHHTGIMDRGRQSLTIAIVPDSGTDQLAGITGSMTIDIKDGKHYYSLAYSLATR